MIGQPARPSSANRRRHLRTVIRVDPSSAATRATPDPAPRTPARSAPAPPATAARPLTSDQAPRDPHQSAPAARHSESATYHQTTDLTRKFPARDTSALATYVYRVLTCRSDAPTLDLVRQPEWWEGVMAEPVRARRLSDEEGRRLLQIGRERLRQILHARGISFQRTRTWKESTDPDRDAKLERIEYVTSRYPDRCFAFDQFGPLSIRPCHGVCWAPRAAFHSIHRSSCPAAARRHFRPLRSEAEPHWYGSIQWVLELLRREGSEVPLGLAVHGLHRASRERDKRGAPVLRAGEDQGARWPEHASGSPPRTLGTGEVAGCRLAAELAVPDEGRARHRHPDRLLP